MVGIAKYFAPKRDHTAQPLLTHLATLSRNDLRYGTHSLRVGAVTQPLCLTVPPASDQLAAITRSKSSYSPDPAAALARRARATNGMSHTGPARRHSPGRLSDRWVGSSSRRRSDG